MARIEQLLEQIRKDRDVRQNLIEIRQNISDESLRRRFLHQLGGDYSFLFMLLEHEDPKVRRNAALILGMTGDESVLPVLFEAWEKEETLFVREDYLKAISGLDYREYLPRLEERISELSANLEETLPETSEEMPAETITEIMPVETSAGTTEDMRTEEEAGSADAEGAAAPGRNPLWDNEKHLLAELSRLRKMTDRYQNHGRHHFTKKKPAPELILRTHIQYADETAEQITCGTVRTLRQGVHVKAGDLNEIMKIRTWLECLLPIPGARPIQGDEKMIASKLRDLKIANYLDYLHEESGQPFRYRIELKSQSVPMEKRGEYIRRIASRLDVLEKGRLLNSDSDYEVELRLIERKDHSLVPMLKLFTIPDTRFFYRKETTAQSTSGPLAALAVRLAAPFLKEGAQVLDPFCGVGTLLIERGIAVRPGSSYGVDHLAEATEKARVNAEAASNVLHAPIYYVNRDFFEFTHTYPFDEIITFLPDVQAGEERAFAEHFLRKAISLAGNEAILIVLTHAPYALKEAAESEHGCSVCENYLLNERTGCSEMIIRFRG